MKVLMYSNRKSDPILWDASTKEKLDAAFLALFHYLDDDWDCYYDLKNDINSDIQQHALYDEARFGNAKAAFRLLSLRISYEYESWELVNVVDPTVN